jgi:hypothetical protein
MVIAQLLVAAAWCHGGHGGRVLVDNDSGCAVLIEVDGREPLYVHADEQAVLWLPYGPATIRATYEQLGRTRTLETERVNVAPHETAYVHLDRPRTGLVYVSNDHGIPVTIEVDGRYVASVGSWDDARFEVPLGSHAFEVFDARGRLVERQLLDVDPWDALRIEVNGPGHRPHSDHGRRPG